MCLYIAHVFSICSDRIFAIIQRRGKGIACLDINFDFFWKRGGYLKCHPPIVFLMIILAHSFYYPYINFLNLLDKAPHSMQRFFSYFRCPIQCCTIWGTSLDINDFFGGGSLVSPFFFHHGLEHRCLQLCIWVI